MKNDSENLNNINEIDEFLDNQINNIKNNIDDFLKKDFDEKSYIQKF